MQIAKVIVTPLKTVLTVLTVLITLIVSPTIAIAAATCPIGQFDGTSVIPDAMNDGLVISRYAQKITGAAAASIAPDATLVNLNLPRIDGQLSVV
jgi:hypothetical protein